MQPDEVSRRLVTGRELCVALARETRTFQRGIESRSAEEIQGFVRNRQEILSRIQKIDTEFADFTQGLGRPLLAAEQKSLDRFLRVREMALLRVLEMDGTLISSARKRMKNLQEDLDALAIGRKAVSRYGGRRTRNARLDMSA